MLRMPANATSTASLAGIDPGSMTLGLGFLRFDVVTLEWVEVKASTLHLDRYLRRGSYWEQEAYGETTTRIRLVGPHLLNAFMEERPISTACEHPFFNPRRGSAFKPLLSVMGEVERAAYEFNRFAPLRYYSPSEVKNGVGAKGGSSKTPVRDAVLKLYENGALPYVGEESIYDLDDNAIDSIAVCITQFNALRRELCLG